MWRTRQALLDLNQTKAAAGSRMLAPRAGSGRRRGAIKKLPTRAVGDQKILPGR
jgi:hypothetical protein